jgi:Domain of unknown function (DUF4145)
MSLRDIAGGSLDQQELHQAWDQIERPMNDRAAAIMAGAFVEDALFRVVGRRSSFHSMIETGFERGLYKGLVRDDLNVIRRVRNAFAHTIRPISFDTAEIVEEVGKFQYPRWIQITGGLSFGAARQENPHREIYTNICRVLINDLFMISISGGVKLDFSQAIKSVDNDISYL